MFVCISLSPLGAGEIYGEEGVVFLTLIEPLLHATYGSKTKQSYQVGPVISLFSHIGLT